MCNPASATAATATATLQAENEFAIVTRWDFAPGQATGWHRHGHPYVVVPVTDGVLRIVSAGGVETLVPLTAGSSYARPEGVEHDVFNGGDAPLSFVEVEIKRRA